MNMIAASTVDSDRLVAALRRDLVYLTQPMSRRHEVLTRSPQIEFHRFCCAALEELDFAHSSDRAMQIHDEWLMMRAQFVPSLAVRLMPWNWTKVYPPAVPKRLAPAR